MARLDGLVKRIVTLEVRRPLKSYAEMILEKLTDDELDRVGVIVEKIERGGVPSTEESVFLDELEAKYGLVQETE